MVDYASLFQIIVSILVWSGIAYAVNYNQNKSVNWLMLLAYEIVGVLVYFTGFAGGVHRTYRPSLYKWQGRLW